MATERVTLRDIYDRFDRFEERFEKRFERIEDRTTVLETYKTNVAGKLTALWFVINLGLVLVIDYFKERIFKTL